MIRNIKKRSISESGKGDETSKVKNNKPMKKFKAENKNDAQNGQTVILKKGNKKGQDKKQVQNVVKKEIKSPSKENNAGKKANQTETTDELKKLQSKLPAKKDELSIEQLKEKIKEMESRPSLTKTAKKKLTVFKKKLSISEGKQSGGEVSAKQTEGNKSLESAKKQEKTKPNKGNVKTDHPQGSFVIKKEEDDEEEEEEEEEMEASEEEDDDDVGDEEDVGEDEEEEEDDEEDEDDDDDDEDDEENAGRTLPKKQKGDESKNKKSTEQEKKKRYTLFVGNIPYSATEDDLKKHFLTKVSEVVCVRIPVKEDTNEPRGFAYVEFSNNTDFEKAFSLHLSTLGGRRINVQFATRNKGADKKEGVAKNFKLHALRKAGKLAGSHKKNQRNSAMKGKQNAKPVQT